MRTKWWGMWGAVGLVLGTNCADDAGERAVQPTKDAGTDSTTDTGPDVASGGDTGTDAPSPSGIGNACTPGPTPQGDCPDGTGCYPAPGGYCTLPCGFATCPSDASCVPSPLAGPLCALKCTSDADCRQSEGYACDPTYGACTGWLLTPKLAQCPATAPLPRTTFGTVTQLSTANGPGKFQMEPAAALDAAGNLTALYMAHADSFEASGLGVSILSASGTLDADNAFASPNKEIFDPWLARDRNGKLHAVWYAHDGFDTNAKIFYANSNDGLVWSSPVDLLPATDCPNGNTGCTDKPMIAIGPDPTTPSADAIYVFYYSSSGERVRRSLDGGQSFEPSVGCGGGAYGDAEVASDGSLHVVSAILGPTSNKLGDVSSGIVYMRSADGGQSFTTPVTVEDTTEPTPFYFSNAQVAHNAATGYTFVVYPTGGPDGAWDIRLAASKDDGASWTRVTVNDDVHCANHATPTLVLNEATGTLHVAWLENRGGVGQVAYTTCLPDGSQCAPNQAVSDTPFATYELVRHSPHWLGEYFTLLIDPTKSEIHAVWTQPVTESDGVRSRIFHAKGGI